MALLPKVKLKAQVNFPADVRAGANIAIDKSNGVYTISAITFSSGLPNFANDAAAAAGGIPINGTYRNGSIIMIRVT